MTKFMQRRFSVSAPISDSYAENYERIFGKKSKNHPPSRLASGLPEQADTSESGRTLVEGVRTEPGGLLISAVELNRWLVFLERALLKSDRIATLDGPSSQNLTGMRELIQRVKKSLALISQAVAADPNASEQTHAVAEEINAAHPEQKHGNED